MESIKDSEGALVEHTDTEFYQKAKIALAELAYREIEKITAEVLRYIGCPETRERYFYIRDRLSLYIRLQKRDTSSLDELLQLYPEVREANSKDIGINVREYLEHMLVSELAGEVAGNSLYEIEIRHLVAALYGMDSKDDLPLHSHIAVELYDRYEPNPKARADAFRKGKVLEWEAWKKGCEKQQ